MIAIYFLIIFAQVFWLIIGFFIGENIGYERGAKDEARRYHKKL